MVFCEYSGFLHHNITEILLKVVLNTISLHVSTTISTRHEYSKAGSDSKHINDINRMVPPGLVHDLSKKNGTAM